MEGNNTNLHWKQWADLKITLHYSNRCKFARKREIWSASLGKNIGYEQDGKHAFFERPVLIIRKVNQHLLWVIPLSTKVKNKKGYYTYMRQGKIYSAILMQLRTISMKRLRRKIGFFPKDDFLIIRNQLKHMI